MNRRVSQRRLGAFFTLCLLSAGSRLCTDLGLVDQDASSSASKSGIRLSLPLDVLYGQAISGEVVAFDSTGAVIDSYNLTKVEDQTSGEFKLVAAR